MIKIKKIKKNINGVTITLFKKEMDDVIVSSYYPQDEIGISKNEISILIDEKISSIKPEDIKLNQIESFSLNNALSEIPGYNDEETFLTSEKNKLIFKPFKKLSFYERIQTIEKIILNYKTKFNSTQIYTNIFQLNFSKRPDFDGIFWNNHSETPRDNYSIKIGNDNPYVHNQTGYSYGEVTDYSMRFMMDGSSGYGWTWTSKSGDTIVPVMSVSSYQLGGYQMKLKGNYITETGRFEQNDYYGNAQMFAVLRNLSISAVTELDGKYLRAVAYGDSDIVLTLEDIDLFGSSLSAQTAYSGDVGKTIVYDASGLWKIESISGSGGVTDHGLLTGLSDDDHPQYLNENRLTGDSHYKILLDSDVLESKVDGTYEYGTLIGNTYDWKFVPSNYDEWTFVGDDAQVYKSGAKDFTIFWDENENVYHIIGIRSIASGFTSGSLLYSSQTDFLWAKSTNLSGSSSFSAVGFIDSISGIKVNGHQIDEVWAPHLIKHDNAYYLFYTGLDWNGTGGYNGATSKQRIFVAKTYDINNWDSPEISFCIDGDAYFTTYSSATDWTYFCRDPYVMWDEEYKRWLMFMAIQVDASYSQNGSINAGAIGIASSTTLMSGWSLYDWIPASETGDNSESPFVVTSPIDEYYLFYSFDSSGVGGPDVWADHIGVMSANTLSDGSDWVSMNETYSATGVASDFVKSRYDDNLWIMGYVAAGDYTNWGRLTFDRGVTFTGINYELAYTGHSACTIPYTSETRIREVDIEQLLIGHINETEIHGGLVRPENLLGSYYPDYGEMGSYNQARFRFNDHVFFNNTNAHGLQTSIYFQNTGATKWAIDIIGVNEDFKLWCVGAPSDSRYLFDSRKVDIVQTLTVSGDVIGKSRIISGSTDLSTIINSAIAGDHTHSITAITASVDASTHELDSTDDIDQYYAAGTGGTGFFAWNAIVPANTPDGAAYKCMLAMNDGAQDQQFVFGGASGGQSLFMRRRDSGVWSSWIQFATTDYVDVSTTGYSSAIMLQRSGGIIGRFISSNSDPDSLNVALQSALSSSVSGDTIIVGSGVYNSNNLIKNGVNYYFSPGAIIDYSGTNTSAIFDFTGTPGTTIIGGNGVFINRGNSATGRQVFNIQTGATVSIECETIYSYSGVAVRASGNGSGNVKIRANKIISQDGTIDNLSDDTTIEIYANEMHSTNGYVVEQDGGKTKVYGAYIHSDSTSVSPIVMASPDCYAELYDCIISANTSQPIFSHEAGSDSTQCKLFNCGISSDQTYQLQGACTTSNCYALDGKEIKNTTSFSTLQKLPYDNVIGIKRICPVTIKNPTATEDYTMMYVYSTGITVDYITTVVNGSGSISATWQMRCSEDRSDGGTLIMSGVANDDINGIVHTSIINPTIPPSNWVWLETTATGGTPITEFHLTMGYRDNN